MSNASLETLARTACISVQWSDASRKDEVARLNARIAASKPASPSPTGRGAQSPALQPFEHLAQTSSPLVIIPLEDALNLKDQSNLLGTIDNHTNWQHRLPRDAIDRLQPLPQSIGTSVQEVSLA